MASTPKMGAKARKFLKKHFKEPGASKPLRMITAKDRETIELIGSKARATKEYEAEEKAKKKKTKKK